MRPPWLPSYSFLSKKGGRLSAAVSRLKACALLSMSRGQTFLSLYFKLTKKSPLVWEISFHCEL